jgi:Zn finger protein HypA/HybF involved in hydrogenase expression
MGKVIKFPKKQEPSKLRCEQCGQLYKLVSIIEDGFYCDECASIKVRMLAVEEMDND